MNEIACIINGLLNAIWDFTQKHETLMGTIIGAFLAAMFGIFTQKYNNYSERKNQIKRYGRMLFCDFENFYHDLTGIKVAIDSGKKDGTLDKSKLFNTVKDNHLFTYNSQWREYLMQISDKIPEFSYKRIVEVYDTLYKIDIAISLGSEERFFELISNLFIYDIFKERVGVNLITNIDIFQILHSISKRGAIRGKYIGDSIEKFFGWYLYIRFSKKIHDIVFAWLKREESIETDDLIERIENWLGEQRFFKYTLIYKASIKNVVSRSLRYSRYINFDWEKCTMIDNSKYKGVNLNE